MNEDYVVLVDEKGRALVNPDGSLQTVGKTEAHKRGLRHRAISVFVFNNDEKVLLQKRAADKYHSGGLWSNTCCSHPYPGEVPSDAAKRRLWEEMKISCPLQEIFQFLYRAEVGGGIFEHEYDHVFVGRHEGPPTPDPTEASDWRWIGCDELMTALDHEPEQYTYWLRHCFAEVVKRAAHFQERSA